MSRLVFRLALVLLDLATRMMRREERKAYEAKQRAIDDDPSGEWNRRFKRVPEQPDAPGQLPADGARPPANHE